MKRIEDGCVDCTYPYTCLGKHCPFRTITVDYCGECGGKIPVGEIYEVDGQDLCVDCYYSKLKKMEEE